jgi:hypothetical protein
LGRLSGRRDHVTEGALSTNPAMLLKRSSRLNFRGMVSEPAPAPTARRNFSIV